MQIRGKSAQTEGTMGVGGTEAEMCSARWDHRLLTGLE